MNTLALGVGLLIVGCSGSDTAPTSDPVPEFESESATESESEVFSEGETQADANGDGVGDTETPTDSTVPSDAESVVTTAVDSAAEGDDIDSDVDSDPETDVDSDPIPDPDVGVDPETGEVDIDLDDVFSLDEIDDVPFCQSYARVFESFLAITLEAVFAQASSDDPDALIAVAETYEVLVYPSLVGDIETIRNEDFEDVDEFFAPLFARIDAAPGLLRDAGLSDDEIAELAAIVRVEDLGAVDLDDLDPRVVDAAVALAAQFGSFQESSEALASTSVDEAELQTELDARCPLLAASFEET